jgi:hypothetical protein
VADDLAQCGTAFDDSKCSVELHMSHKIACAFVYKIAARMYFIYCIHEHARRLVEACIFFRRKHVFYILLTPLIPSCPEKIKRMMVLYH